MKIVVLVLLLVLVFVLVPVRVLAWLLYAGFVKCLQKWISVLIIRSESTRKTKRILYHSQVREFIKMHRFFF